MIAGLVPPNTSVEQEKNRLGARDIDLRGAPYQMCRFVGIADGHAHHEWHAPGRLTSGKNENPLVPIRNRLS
jgi:hypothetical protein